MPFRDAFGRTYGDAFGCCPQLPPQYGTAIYPTNLPFRAQSLQPQSRALRGMYGQPYGATDAELTAMGWGPQPSTGGGGGGKVNWNQIGSGVGGFLSALFPGKNQSAPAPAPTVAPGYPAQPYPYPPPPAATASWVLPAALIGGVGVVGTIVYLLTK